MGLMDIRRRILADAPQLATATGAIASFTTDMAVPLKSCQFEINPVQSGTGDPSPSNVRPITGWTGVSGQRTGVNLFDKTQAVANERFNTTSTTSAYGTTRTPYIPCKPNTTYYFANVYGAEIMYPVFWYDADKNYISYSGVTGTTPASGTATSPSNAAYMGVNFKSDYLDSVSINYPSTDTAYHAYAGNTYPVEFPAQGKNLLDMAGRTVVTSSPNPPSSKRDFVTKKVYVGISANNYFNNGNITSYTITDTSVTGEILSAGAGYGFGYTMPCEPNTQYTVSKVSTGGQGGTGISYFDAEGNYIDYTNSSTFTTPSNCYNLIIVLRPYAGASATFTEVQVEKGSSATTYEPYTNTVYGGTVDVVSGVLTVDREVLNAGYMGWATLNASAHTYFANYTKALKGSNVVCAIYKTFHTSTDSDFNANAPDLSINTYLNSGGMRIKDTTVAGIDALRERLNGVSIVFELAEPRTYQLTPQQITALKGMNNVWADTGSTTVKYWKH